MTFSLIIAVLATVVAAVALVRARNATRRAERLSESYWELRYEIGQLKVRATRLETSTGLTGAEAETAVAAPSPASSTTSFIPLSSLKK